MTVTDVSYEPHSWPIPDDGWWACAQPERPAMGDDCWIETNCRACVVALGATARHIPNEPGYRHGPDAAVMTAIEVYEEVRHDFGLPPVPVSEAGKSTQ